MIKYKIIRLRYPNTIKYNETDFWKLLFIELNTVKHNHHVRRDLISPQNHSALMYLLFFKIIIEKNAQYKSILLISLC